MTKAQKQAIVDYAAYQFACARANRKTEKGGKLTESEALHIAELRQKCAGAMVLGDLNLVFTVVS